MRIVAAMRMNGHALSKITSLRYIVQPEHFEATIRRLKQQTGAKDLRQLGSYVSVLHWLGETWVRLSDTKMRKLATAMHVVGRRRAEIADSSLEVLDQLYNPLKRERAKKLGDTVFAEFHAKGDTATRKDAAAFREALYWELGLTTGWRPRSRARINVEEDIHWRGRKGREIATLTAPKGSEKTELRRRVELPPTTSRILRFFIDHARRLLSIVGDNDNPYLFTGRFGSHINSGHLSKKSEKLVGLRTRIVGATGHKTRHVSVKLHLDENPGDWQTAQEHVGHRNPETTRRIYALVTQV
ncbi:MAG: tyrosine-type recombinase/integrase, partial [Xanthobacteraceae bacterium]